MKLFKRLCACGSGCEQGFCTRCSHGADKDIPTAVQRGRKVTEVYQVDLRSSVQKARRKNR